MKHTLGEGLIGLKVRLYSNGDISVLDCPKASMRDCFGPKYGSESLVFGKIVDFNIFNIFYDYSHYDQKNHNDKMTTRVYIWIEYNDFGRFGLHTSPFSFTLDEFKEFITYTIENVKQGD